MQFLLKPIYHMLYTLNRHALDWITSTADCTLYLGNVTLPLSALTATTFVLCFICKVITDVARQGFIQRQNLGGGGELLEHHK